MEEKKDYYVYIYLNQTKKGKWLFKNLEFEYQPFYVGKGRKKRDITHLCQYSLKAHNFKNSIIKSIVSKTGEQPIHYRVYENLSNSEAIELEIEMIKHFGRKDNKTGILANCTDGGDGANNFSEETLKKVGNPKKKIYQYDLNGVFIKEWESLSSVNLTIHIGNLSSAIKRKGTFMGFIWSYSFKEKMEPTIKYQMPNKYIDIQQIDKETNKVLQTFNSALQIEQELGLISGSRNKIYDAINGKLKTAYGYKWKLK